MARRVPLGFIATAAWLVGMLVRGRTGRSDLRSAIQDGYRLGFIGLAVFAAGGIGDAVAHTVFGFAGPTVMWTSVFGLLIATEALEWQPELWGGAIVFAGLYGVVLQLLVVHPTNFGSVLADVPLADQDGSTMDTARR